MTSLLIWEQWMGDGPTPGLASGPVCIPTPASTPVFKFAPTPVFASASSATKKSLADTSWNDAAIISNTKVRIEKSNVSTLPSLAAPRSVDQSKVRAAIMDDSVVVVDLCESGDETETETKTETQLFKTKRIFTSNEAPVIGKTSKSIKVIKLGSTVKSARPKAIKKPSDDSEPEDVMTKISPTLSSTRKRRPAIDYGHIFEHPILDRSNNDDDFQCEEVDNNDERLDKSFEKGYPNLKTPSKRQKRAKR
jgi:hypothetical protein